MANYYTGFSFTIGDLVKEFYDYYQTAEVPPDWYELLGLESADLAASELDDGFGVASGWDDCLALFCTLSFSGDGEGAASSSSSSGTPSESLKAVRSKVPS